MAETKFTVNGEARSVDMDASTPLLWVIREQLKLPGTKFGCGIAQCGACTVHLDGAPGPILLNSGYQQSQGAPDVTTIEGIARQPMGRFIAVQTGLGRAPGAPMRLLPVRPDHVGRCTAVAIHRRTRPTPTSTRPCAAISADAAPMAASARRSNSWQRLSPRRCKRDMDNGKVDAQRLYRSRHDGGRRY
jgi:hypothetical protein